MVELESKITILEHQSKQMSEDMNDMKQSLRNIASAMQSLAVLEEKHQSSFESIKRAHTRLDGTEERLRKVELQTAGSLWVERVVWIAVATAINYFLSAS